MMTFVEALEMERPWIVDELTALAFELRPVLLAKGIEGFACALQAPAGRLADEYLGRALRRLGEAAPAPPARPALRLVPGGAPEVEPGPEAA